MISDKEIKKIVSDIITLLPVHSNTERLFLRNMEMNITEYSESHPNAKMKEIYDHFGAPADIVRSYIESMDLDILIQKISIRRTLRRFLAIILICVVVGLVIFSGFTYKAYREYKNTVVHEIETIVEGD